MASEETRVLVVDDSAVIRSLIADSITATPGMKVVGTAEDGQKALEMLDAVRPNVITLDVQMPRMDGLATLDAILARRPIPVIMVSSLTRLGAEIAWMPLTAGPWTTWRSPITGRKPGPLFGTTCRGRSVWRPVATCNGSWRSAASSGNESPSGSAKEV